ARPDRLDPFGIGPDLAPRSQSADPAEGDAVAVLPAPAHEWKPDSRVEKSVPDSQERRRSVAGVHLDRVHFAQHGVDQGLPPGETGLGSVGFAPDDESIL